MAFAPFTTAYTPEPTSCAGGTKPGTRILQDWACDESPWAVHLWDVGSYACRDVFGGWCPNCRRDALSAHASGRAGDAAHNIVGGASHWAGIEFANWLVANHAVLGIQEVICNRRRWTLATGWRAYGGLSPHIDHVHWTQNQSGALYLTRARLLSVAPTTEVPFMATLTAAQQKELLDNSRAAKLLLTAINNTVQPHLIRKKGTTGLTSVCLAVVNVRVPIKTQASLDAIRKALPDDTIRPVAVALFNTMDVLT